MGKITNLQLLTVAWPTLQALFFTPLNVDFKHLTCFEIQADKKVLGEWELTDEKLSPKGTGRYLTGV